MFCGNCGRTVFEYDQFCPQCGRQLTAPVIARQSRRGCGFYLGVACATIFGLMILGEIIKQTSGTKQNLSPEEKKAVDKEHAALVVAAEAVKQLRASMRNPDSFKLTKALLMNSGTVCYEFRSQNGFGGMNSGHAVLLPTGKFLTDEISGGTALWNKECAGITGADKTWDIGYVAGFHGVFTGDEK